MLRDVCYRVEEVGGSIILTQIWSNNRHYIKMSKSAAAWIFAQIDSILNSKERHDSLSEKAFNCNIDREKKQAEKMFGGIDETKH